MISLIKTSLECQQEKIISQCEIHGCPDGTIVRVVHVGPELSGAFSKIDHDFGTAEGQYIF